MAQARDPPGADAAKKRALRGAVLFRVGRSRRYRFLRAAFFFGADFLAAFLAPPFFIATRPVLLSLDAI